MPHNEKNLNNVDNKNRTKKFNNPYTGFQQREASQYTYQVCYR